MNETEPAETGSHLKVGEQLAEARQKLGLKLQDIAESTRIPLRHLVSLEASRHEALPATTYSVGFIRSYARLVGLDADALSSAFRDERSDHGSTTFEYAPFEPADPSRTPPKLLAAIGLATALLFALGWMLWRGLDGSDLARQTSLAMEASSAPAAAPRKPAPATAAAQPSDKDPVTLTASPEEVWIKVTDGPANILFMGTLEVGKSYAVPVDAVDPRLLTGRPDGLKIAVGARTYPALVPDLRTVRDVSLKPVALVAFIDAAKAAPDPAAAKPAETDRPLAKRPRRLRRESAPAEADATRSDPVNAPGGMDGNN